MQTDHEELARRVEATEGNPTVLRFSQCQGQYRWAGIRTSDSEAVTALCEMWNNRKLIATALRALKGKDNG